jgi:1-acyl-sn-glycerol-3-phosphate acyltransferase
MRIGGEAGVREKAWLRGHEDRIERPKSEDLYEVKGRDLPTTLPQARAKEGSTSLIDVRAGKPPNDKLVSKLFWGLEHLASYHDYRVEGLENIPKTGPCIVAFNHSLATYDIALFAKECAEERGRKMRMLGDHLIFQIPGLSQIATELGMVDGRPGPARSLVQSGELVGVAPGGQEEMLRPSTEAYQLRWDDHRGFARLAMESGAPVVLAACPRADDIYEIPKRANDLITKKIFKLVRAPVIVAKGLYNTMSVGFGTPQIGVGFAIPKPIPLKHVLSEPISPPEKPRPDAKPGDADYEAVLDAFHKELIAKMKALMQEGLSDS